jgi:hypothetical protein
MALGSCPERTSEKNTVSDVLSGRSVIPDFPATAWLANFLRRFATTGWFLQSTSNIEHPTSIMMTFLATRRAGFANHDARNGQIVPLRLVGNEHDLN